MTVRRVTLVHGFLGAPEDWDGVVALLGPRVRADRVDLHELGCESVDAAAERLAARIRGSGCDALVGYSMGGRIALAASRAPGAGFPCVLLSTGPGTEGDAARAARAAEDDARSGEIVRDGLPAFVERWYRMPMFAALRGSDRFDAVRARRAAGDGAFWAACVRGCSPGRSAPLWDALPRLARGSSFAVGSRDDRYASFADRVEREVPGVRVVRIAGAGHALPLEAPAECADLVDQALGTQP